MLTEVTIKIDGDEITLAVNLKAAMAVNKIAGGFMPLFERLASADIEAFAAILSAGSGKPRAVMEDAVFRNGAAALVQPLTEYVATLATGGKKPSEAEADKDAKPGE